MDFAEFIRRLALLAGDGLYEGSIAVRRPDKCATCARPGIITYTWRAEISVDDPYAYLEANGPDPVKVLDSIAVQLNAHVDRARPARAAEVTL